MEQYFKWILNIKIIGPIITIIIGLVFFRIVKAIVKKILTRDKNTFEKKKRATIIELITNVIKFFVYCIMAIIILEIYGIDTASIVASLGVVGIVLGFALQETAKDFISGILIITDNYYVLGDIVTINDFTGEVIELTLKSTKLKSASGQVYVLANHNVTTVKNLSQERTGLYINIPTAYEESTEKVEEVIEQILKKVKKIPNVYPDSAYLGIDSLNDSSINYLIVVYCKQSEQWTIKRKVLRIVKLAYEENQIKIPYSQIEVHNGKEII